MNEPSHVHRRRLVARSGRPSGALAGALGGALLMTVACGTAPQQGSLPGAPTGRDADRLLVVDCLLPGQLRRLGRNINFMTPRRATKASASECEIRGGEYVAYDRANFATSLKIWLPQAESGDAHAQTLVGEIFEKGLGQVADPTIAAEWYRRAAEQGYSRARINLGYLYESGLGVERDLTRAMNLYRQAAGFDDGSLEYVTSVELVTRQQQAAELPVLREQVRQADEQLSSERRAFASLQDEVQRLERQAQAARAAALSQARQPVVATGDAATRGSSDADGADDARVAELIERMKTQEASLAEADRRSEALVEQLSAQQRQTGELRQRINEAGRQLAEAERTAATQRSTTARLEAELAAARTRTDAEAAARVADLQAQLGSAVGASDELGERIAQLTRERDASTGDLQAQLSLAETKEASLLSDLDGTRDQLARVQATLARTDADYRERLAALGATTGSLQQRVATQQGTIAKLEQQLQALESAVPDETRSQADAQAIAELRTELSAARSALGEAEAGRADDGARSLAALAELEAELERQRARVDDKQAEIGLLEQRVSTSQAATRGPTIETVANVIERGPVIEIIDPPVSVGESGLSIPYMPGAGVVDVVGRVSPATDLISFSINGGAESVNQHGVFKHAASVSGTPRLALSAVDTAGDRTAVELQLTSQGETRGVATAEDDTRGLEIDVSRVDFGSYHALVIGNADYASMSDLDSATIDATALSRVLESRYGFGTELLLDADRYDILAALNRKRDELGRSDNLLIFFAGHSQVGGGQGYWMPVDADPADKSTWISNVALTGLVDAMDAKHVMIIADSVFPATLSQSSIPRLGRSMDADQRLQLYELASSSKVRTVLTSGAAEPVTNPNDARGRSMFGTSVIDALSEGAGNVTMAHDVFVQIRERMESAGGNEQSASLPRYAPMRYAGHENGEFLFVSTDRQVGALNLID